jgi:hypothetical protein
MIQAPSIKIQLYLFLFESLHFKVSILNGYIFQYVSQRVQINVIFSDNVRILSLSCNIKKFKTSVKFLENSRSKRRSNRFQWCHLLLQLLFYYHFLLALYIMYQKCLLSLTVIFEQFLYKYLKRCL